MSTTMFAQDPFKCMVCVDQLKDPVTIPCGHSYCMDCIKDHWAREDHVYSCPQCPQTFTPRPALNINSLFAEVLKKLQPAPPVPCYTGPGDVACDVCTGRKRKAVKSCLVCLASYCETHLKLHDELNPGKRHKLINATGNLQEKICSHHDKMLEVYCRTDQQCICYLCTMDQHRGHDTVAASAERTEKQMQLGPVKKKTQQRIQEREKKVQDLRQTVQSVKRSAQTAVDDCERIFTELIQSIERRRFEVKKQIRDQEKAGLSQTEGLLERLEQEIAELRRRDAELEQLSHTEDHIHFLQSCQSLSASPGPGDLPSITVSPNVSFEAARKSASELKERLEGVSQGELVHISQAGIHTQRHSTGTWSGAAFTELTNQKKVGTRAVGERPKPPPRPRVSILKPVGEPPNPQPRKREDFLKYSCRLTLDSNTAHRSLRLSNGNREVTCVGNNLSYPEHSERFNSWFQVLCKEDLSGRCYWEAEWSSYRVSIAVSYKEINRKGRGSDCALGGNNKSWSLFCSPSTYSFWHNNESTEIPVPSSSRIGVYLDHRAGTLSFYSITASDTMTLLYRVQTTFTQPLCPGFGMYCYGSSVKLCDLE